MCSRSFTAVVSHIVLKSWKFPLKLQRMDQFKVHHKIMINEILTLMTSRSWWQNCKEVLGNVIITSSEPFGHQLARSPVPVVWLQGGAIDELSGGTLYGCLWSLGVLWRRVGCIWCEVLARPTAYRPRPDRCQNPWLINGMACIVYPAISFILYCRLSSRPGARPADIPGCGTGGGGMEKGQEKK